MSTKYCIGKIILCREKFIRTRIRILAPGMACCHALRSTIHELQFAGLDYRKPFSFPFFFASRRKHRFTEWLGLTISQKLFLKFHSFYHSHALVFSQYAYLVFIKTWKFWNWKFRIDFNPLLTPQESSTPNSFLFTRPPISFGNEILFLATKRESQIIMPEYVWIKLRYSEKAQKNLKKSSS